MSVAQWTHTNNTRYRNIVQYLLDNGPTSIAELKRLDYADSRIMDSCQKLHSRGVFDRARLNGTANGTVYAIYGTADMGEWVDWDVAYDDPSDYLDNHKPDNYTKSYDYIKHNGPGKTSEVANGIEENISTIRATLLNLHRYGILDRITAIGVKGYVYGIPGEIDGTDIKEIDYQRESETDHKLRRHILDMLELMKDKDRSYWKANHLENEGFKMTTITNALGVLSSKGYIEKWQGDSGPWIITEKGKNVNRADVL